MHITELFKKGIDNGQIPRILYKYRSIASTIQFLNNPALYFSDARTFNDPFEFRAIWQPSRDISDWVTMMISEGMPPHEAQIRAAKIVTNPVLANQLLDTSVSGVQNALGVYCLSLVPDQLLMWAHYADNHTGVCLAFDMAEDLEAFCFPKQVIYDDAYPVVKYPHYPPQTTEPLFHKSSYWAYEQEYRIIKLNHQGLVNVRRSALREIIFGCRCSVDDQAKIRAAAAIFPNVTFRHARMAAATYTLNI